MGHLGGRRQMFDARRQLGVISEDGSSTPGRNRLVSIEAQRAHHTKRASVASPNRAPKRFSRIFDQCQVKILRDRHDAVNIHWMSEGMHRNDTADDAACRAVHAFLEAHFCDGLEVLPQRGGIQTERPFFAVDEVRSVLNG